MAIKDFKDLYWKLVATSKGVGESAVEFSGAGLYVNKHGEYKYFNKHPDNPSEWILVTDVTKVLDSTVKSDRAKLEQYFGNAIDQIAFDTQDWKRFKQLLIDMYAAHRALISNQKNMSDPHFFSNSDLDELFRSFGYSQSVVLKSFDENPLENKVQLFLDLVNLYKIKGTPRSILEVLQYYGIPNLDIFEFWLQKISKDSLIFKGEAVAGTTTGVSNVYLPYELLTNSDPHWLYTEEQIINLHDINKINLPSKTPYFAVQPVVEMGVESAIFARLVFDQYYSWESSGELPPQNADVSILGISSSLLELYLLTLYVFHKEYNIGSEIPLFLCYDGTNTTSAAILAEYEELIAPPFTRALKNERYQQYLDLFTRKREEHFLYGYDGTSGIEITPEYLLTKINPAILAEVNALATDNNTILQSFLKDIAIWVRNNIGYGFVNTGYIFFGLNQLFEELKPVINFFKPYRARLIVLEMLRFNNLLTESIFVEDDLPVYEIENNSYDRLIPPTLCPNDCIDATSIECIDNEYCSEYPPGEGPYDCGAYYDSDGMMDDYRACDGKGLSISIDIGKCIPMRCPPGFIPDSTSATLAEYDSYCDRLNSAAPQPTYTYDATSGCIIDSTNAYVFSETVTNTTERIESLVIGSSEMQIFFPEPMSNDQYILNINLFNQNDGYDSSMYGVIVSQKTAEYFTVKFSSPLDSIHYRLGWNVDTESSESGTENLTINQKIHRIDFDDPMPNSNYSISTALINEIDPLTSIYNYIVINKDLNGFDVEFSGFIDSSNYYLDWNVYDSATVYATGVVDIIPEDTQWLEVDIDEQEDDQYSLAVTLENTIDSSASVYAYIITKKTPDNFLIRFSSPIDSTNYNLCWAITYLPGESYIYRQESGFREFDSYGTFDCTHGFDVCEITMEQVTGIGVITQENNYWLQQESALSNDDYDYGLLLE